MNKIIAVDVSNVSRYEIEEYMEEMIERARLGKPLSASFVPIKRTPLQRFKRWLVLGGLEMIGWTLIAINIWLLAIAL